jgi:hypothetical protein
MSMTLGDFNWSIRRYLRSRIGSAPSREDTFDLLATLLGYQSFSSLASDAVIVRLHGAAQTYIDDVIALRQSPFQIENAAMRHEAIGADGEAGTTAQALADYADARILVAIPHSILVDPDSYPDFDATFETLRVNMGVSALLCALQENWKLRDLPIQMLESEFINKPELAVPLWHIYYCILDCCREDSPYRDHIYEKTAFYKQAAATSGHALYTRTSLG